MLRLRRKAAALIAAAGGLAAANLASAATLQLQLLGSGYDPATGNWADSAPAGGANSGFQGTAAARPGVTTTPSGAPALRFDGDDDFVSLPNFLTGFTAAEVFVAIRANEDPKDTTPDTGLWYLGTHGANSHYTWEDENIYDGFGSDTRRDPVGNPATLLTNYHTYNVLSAPAEWTARLSNATDGTVTLRSDGANTVAFPTDPKIGEGINAGAFNFEGDIAELRIYSFDPNAPAGDPNARLTDAERQAVFTELNRYGIVPEPTSLALLGLGGLALLARRRRQR